MLHCRYLMLKFSEILILVYRKIFSAIFSSKVPFAKFWSEKCSYKRLSNAAVCKYSSMKCYCKFPDNRKNYQCWCLFLIHVLIKLQDWWPTTLLKKRPQHRCFPVNILKCLKKTFYETPPMAASENGFEEFLWISKGDLTWNDLYDLTNLSV